MIVSFIIIFNLIQWNLRYCVIHVIPIRLNSRISIFSIVGIKAGSIQAVYHDNTSSIELYETMQSVWRTIYLFVTLPRYRVDFNVENQWRKWPD